MNQQNLWFRTKMNSESFFVPGHHTTQSNTIQYTPCKPLPSHKHFYDHPATRADALRTPSSSALSRIISLRHITRANTWYLAKSLSHFTSLSMSGHTMNEVRQGSLAGGKYYPTNPCPCGILTTVWSQSSFLLAHWSVLLEDAVML
jgi:hypothetical protein